MFKANRQCLNHAACYSAATYLYDAFDITLSTAGFYRDAHVARDRADGYRDLMDARGNLISEGSR